MDVPGHPGYQASSAGRVRSVGRMVDDGLGHLRRVPARYLTPRPHRSGHLMVTLSSRGKERKFRVHRLVLNAFVGPCPDGMECCHWNDEPPDNRLMNLRWDTPSANKRDAVRNGLNPMTQRTHCPSGHEYTPENTRICSRSGGRKFRQCLACARLRGPAACRRWRERRHRKEAVAS